VIAGSGNSGREQETLAVVHPRVAEGRELVARLDAFRDHRGVQIRAQPHDARHQLLLALAAIDAEHEPAVELHHARLEIDDALQVRVAGAEIVDDEVHAAAHAHLLQHRLAELEVRERHRLRHFQEHVVVVRVDGIVRAHEPALLKLLRVDVQEQG
jgi:hypothetical protein